MPGNKRRWRWVSVALATAALSVVVVTIQDRNPSPDRELDSLHSPRYAGPTPDTEDVLTIEDLVPTGIDLHTVDRVEPEIRALNDALKRLAAAHRDYHAAVSEAERLEIEGYSRSLHLAVDRSEHVLHEVLTRDELVRFHAALWPRLAAVGLTGEQQHHEDGGIGSGIVRGLDHTGEDGD